MNKGKSIWTRADELIHQVVATRELTDAAQHGPATKRLCEDVANLALLVRDIAEKFGLRNEGIDHPLLEGVEYELTIKVRARITDKEVECNDEKDPERVTGFAYEVSAYQGNFLEGRTFNVDAHEIVDARILP